MNDLADTAGLVERPARGDHMIAAYRALATRERERAVEAADEFDAETRAEARNLAEIYDCAANAIHAETARADALLAALAGAREALNWYEQEASAASRAMSLPKEKQNPDTLLAILTVLALDGGKRTASALRIIEGTGN